MPLRLQRCTQAHVIRALSCDPVNGRWLLTGLAGRGSSATVYRGFDLVSERAVAIKALGGRRTPARMCRRARREFLLLASLRHPNLVEAYGLETAESGPLPAGTPFLTMELLESAGIAPAGAAAEPHRLAKAALGLLAALECVHAHGLVHRDIKPSNVLLDRGDSARERVKLSDLGLALHGSDRSLGSRAPAGTLHYAAPEIIAGERGDGRSDLYSLGVLLFEAATGALPFSDSDPAAALEWHLRGSRVPKGTAAAFLPPVLARVIVRMLAVRPENRFHHARDVWEEIAEAMSPPGGNDPAWSDGSCEGPFIGRGVETRRLARWLMETPRTGGRLRIIGPPGCGRSRLAREAARLGRAEGWSVHAWSCRPGDPPFVPLRAPLREMILRSSGTGARRHPPSESEILALLGGPALWDAPGRVQAQALEPLARSLSGFLASHVSAERPLMIVLDDFDLADEGTRRVVDALGQSRDRGGGERADQRERVSGVDGVLCREGNPLRAGVGGTRGDGSIVHASGAPLCPGILIVTALHGPPSASMESASSLVSVGGIRGTSAESAIVRATRAAGIVRAPTSAEIVGTIRREEQTSGPMAALGSIGVGRALPAVHPGRGSGRARRGREGFLDSENLTLGALSREQARRLVQSVPGARALGPAEVEQLVRDAEGMPGRLVRLAYSMAGRQRLLFPPLSEPRAMA